MSANFKSRFMNRMEHVTKSGHTSSQRKTTSTPSAAPSSVRAPSTNQTTEFSQQIPNTDYLSTPGSVSQHTHTLSHTTRPNVSSHVAANFFPNYESSPQRQNTYVQTPDHSEYAHPPTNHKPTAQQFQTYLNEFSPMQQQQQQNQRRVSPQQFNYNEPSNHQNNTLRIDTDSQYHANHHVSSYPEFKENYGTSMHHNQSITPNVINADFTSQSMSYDPYHRDSQSEDFGKMQRHQRKQRASRPRHGANSARLSAQDKRRGYKKPPLRRPVSLEYSRKPRKIQYTPYTLSELSAISGPVNSGTGTLGPDLEDDRIRQKNQTLQKVHKYAELVKFKNKQHRPRPKVHSATAKSKSQIARDYAKTVHRVNKKKLRYKTGSERDVTTGPISGHRTSPQFKRTGSEAVSQSHSYHHHQQQPRARAGRAGSGGKEQTEKLQELQQLHMRNRAIAQHILNDTFG